MKGKTFGSSVFDVINLTFMVFIIIVTLYPFVYVVMASISSPVEFFGHQGVLLAPKGFSMISYEYVFKNPSILTGYKNTLILVTGGTTYNVFMTALGAYVLSRKELYWKKAFMMMIVFTMFFNGGLIPNYLLVNNALHLGNNLLALIIPGSIATMNLIIMRTFFQSIPFELEESARIDGARDFTVLFKIILPLSMPVIAVMLLYYGVAHWNQWFGAMIYLRKREMYPIQLILREILIIGSTDSMMTSADSADRGAIDETLKYATIMVTTIPILFAYPFLQKYFIKGVMIGALKG